MIRSNLPVLSNRFSANWAGDRWAQNSWVPDSRSPVPSWAKGPSCPCPDWPRSNFFDILHIAYCRMSQNTHFVCYFVRLKMTSVVFFSLFSSLPSFDGRTLSIYALNAIMSNKIRMVRQFCTRAMLLYTWICVWRSCIPDGVWISTSNYVEITESTERVRFNEAFKIRSMPTFSQMAATASRVKGNLWSFCWMRWQPGNFGKSSAKNSEKLEDVYVKATHFNVLCLMCVSF